MASLKAVAIVALWSVVAVKLFAVVTHKPDPPAPIFYQSEDKPNSLTLYNKKGEKVAKCQIVDDGETISACRIEDGFTLDDVMTSWSDAYKNKPSERDDK
jgi:hypothetical protein